MSPAGKGNAGRLRLAWLAMAVVVIAALAVGTFDRDDRSDAQRAQDLAETIRCPSCKSQSAASSDTPASEAVRSLIRDRIKAGDSDDAIRDFVAARYGRKILLDPSSKGFSGLVWALPVMLVVVAVAALVFRFRDWRPSHLAATDDDRALVEDALARAGSASDATADATTTDGPADGS